MPSPFPGMDPFLESPDYFPSFHARFIMYLCDDLQPHLPEPYFAETSERLWIETSERHIEPDVNVFRVEVPTPERKERGGGVAVAEATLTEPVLVIPPIEERRQLFLEIYARGDGERLVTSIEMLSLSNKTGGEKGRGADCASKAKCWIVMSIWSRSISYCAGQHTTAVPLEYCARKDGAVSLSRLCQSL